MHRFIFWGIIILVLLIVAAIIDQAFYRLVRLFVDKHTALIIRLVTAIVVIAGIVGSVLWGRYVTRLRLDVSQAELVSQRVPSAFDGFKIAHISDFHLDSFDKNKEMGFVEEIIDRIANEQPDIVCFTGDPVSYTHLTLPTKA